MAYWYEGVPDYATDLKTAEFVDCPKCGGSGPARDDCSGCGGGRWEHPEVTNYGATTQRKFSQMKPAAQGQLAAHWIHAAGAVGSPL